MKRLAKLIRKGEDPFLGCKVLPETWKEFAATPPETFVRMVTSPEEMRKLKHCKSIEEARLKTEKADQEREKKRKEKEGEERRKLQERQKQLEEEKKIRELRRQEEEKAKKER